MKICGAWFEKFQFYITPTRLADRSPEGHSCIAQKPSPLPTFILKKILPYPISHPFQTRQPFFQHWCLPLYLKERTSPPLITKKTKLDPSSPANYRHISNLSTMSKLLETHSSFDTINHQIPLWIDSTLILALTVLPSLGFAPTFPTDLIMLSLAITLPPLLHSLPRFPRVPS